MHVLPSTAIIPYRHIRGLVKELRILPRDRDHAKAVVAVALRRVEPVAEGGAEEVR
jgi:hypothetical protein